jgi:hypothetical protein
MARHTAGLVALLLLGSAAGLNFSAVFGNGMVLQRDELAAVYGTAAHGETVKVVVQSSEGVQDATSAATAATDGSWKVMLQPHKAGGNYTIAATGSSGSSAVLADVTFGGESKVLDDTHSGIPCIS